MNDKSVGKIEEPIAMALPLLASSEFHDEGPATISRHVATTAECQ